jgi:uncharacterized phiE125 gp8 family phage protein
MARYGLLPVTPPATEALTLAEAKSHLRITGDDEDTLILGLISAAREWFERQTYRQLVTATWDLVLDALPSGSGAIRIPRAPLQSVASVKYYDEAGVLQTVPATDYVVTISEEPGLIRCGQSLVWPTAATRPDAVTVRFTAGYGAAAAVPQLVRSALKLMIGSLFEHREEMVDRQITALPLGAQRIIAFYDLGDELTEYGATSELPSYSG